MAPTIWRHAVLMVFLGAFVTGLRADDGPVGGLVQPISKPCQDNEAKLKVAPEDPLTLGVAQWCNEKRNFDEVLAGVSLQLR